MKRTASPGSCEWVCSRLSAYLDGELNLELVEHVNRHLAMCGACERELDREGQLLVDTYDVLIPGAVAGELSLSARTETVWTSSSPQSRIVPETPASRRGMTMVRGLAAASLLAIVQWLALSTPEANLESPVGPVAVKSVPTPWQPSPSTAEVRLTRGDVNSDGIVTSADLHLLARILDATPDAAADLARCPAAGDFDDDGELTPNDYALAARSLYGEQLAATNPAVPFARTVAYLPDQGLACDYVCP